MGMFLCSSPGRLVGIEGNMYPLKYRQILEESLSNPELVSETVLIQLELEKFCKECGKTSVQMCKPDRDPFTQTRGFICCQMCLNIGPEVEHAVNLILYFYLT